MMKQKTNYNSSILGKIEVIDRVSHIHYCIDNRCFFKVNKRNSRKKGGTSKTSNILKTMLDEIEHGKFQKEIIDILEQKKELEVLLNDLKGTLEKYKAVPTLPGDCELLEAMLKPANGT